MDLVTVTCSRDLKRTLLHSHSIEKFVVSRCTHWVIIEDNVLSVEQWQNYLAPYYKKHNLKIIANLLPHDTIQDGWQRQQILKFYASNYVQSDTYLILDSKNFFIKSVDLADWPIQEGCHSIASTSINSLFYTWVTYLTATYNLPDIKNHWDSTSPFRVKTNVVKEILKLDMIEMIKNCPNNSISEFLLYSQFVNPQELISTSEIVRIAFNSTELPTIDEFEQIKNNQDIKLLSVHWDAITGNSTDLLNPSKLDILHNFLISIGLNQLLVKDLKKFKSQL